MLLSKASKSNLVIKQSLFLSRLSVTVTISITCHVVAGNSNLKYILECTNDKFKQKGEVVNFLHNLTPWETQSFLWFTHIFFQLRSSFALYLMLDIRNHLLLVIHLCTAVRICLEGAKWTAILVVESYHTGAKMFEDNSTWCKATTVVANIISSLSGRYCKHLSMQTVTIVMFGKTWYTCHLVSMIPSDDN